MLLVKIPGDRGEEPRSVVCPLPLRVVGMRCSTDARAVLTHLQSLLQKLQGSVGFVRSGYGIYCMYCYRSYRNIGTAVVAERKLKSQKLSEFVEGAR